jgi:hypothetical protein
VREVKVLHKLKEQRNIIHTVKRKKANRIGHILRGNCLIKRIIKREIKGATEVAVSKEEDVNS